MPLQELINILSSLNKDQICYCSWKSNANLSKSFESRTDFDLLISAADSQRFYNLVKDRGLKQRKSSKDKTYTDMVDYLGLDYGSGKMFHLHVHFKLIFGKRFQKNYRLPIEELVLTNSIFDEVFPIRIIQPELEYILLILRSILKTDYSIKSVARTFLRSTVFPANILNEYSHLKKKLDPAKFDHYAETILPDLKAFFLKMKKIDPGDLTLLKVHKLYREITTALKPYQLSSKPELQLELKKRKRAAHNSRSWITPGGVSFAFVGADGSGKSTTVSHIQKWLGWKLSIQSFYMGLPKDNPVWKFLGYLTRICIILRLGSLKKLLDIYRALFAAKLRNKCFQHSEKLRNQGNIILFDRFPLKQFWFMDEPIDGPRLKNFRHWKEKELKFYEAIKEPDHIFVLKVGVAESIERKVEHQKREKLTLIQKKVAAVDKLIQAYNNRFVVIDTSIGQERSLLELKRNIWELL
jgi:thymidylate kinase